MGFIESPPINSVRSFCYNIMIIVLLAFITISFLRSSWIINYLSHFMCLLLYIIKILKEEDLKWCSIHCDQSFVLSLRLVCAVNYVCYDVLSHTRNNWKKLLFHMSNYRLLRIVSFSLYFYNCLFTFIVSLPNMEL